MDRECDRHLGKLHLEDRLLSLFTNACQVSTKFDTITIHYYLDELIRLYGDTVLIPKPWFGQ